MCRRDQDSIYRGSIVPLHAAVLLVSVRLPRISFGGKIDKVACKAAKHRRDVTYFVTLIKCDHSVKTARKQRHQHLVHFKASQLQKSSNYSFVGCQNTTSNFLIAFIRLKLFEKPLYRLSFHGSRSFGKVALLPCLHPFTLSRHSHFPAISARLLPKEISIWNTHVLIVYKNEVVASDVHDVRVSPCGQHPDLITWHDVFTQL